MFYSMSEPLKHRAEGKRNKKLYCVIPPTRMQYPEKVHQYRGKADWCFPGAAGRGKSEDWVQKGTFFFWGGEHYEYVLKLDYCDGCTIICICLKLYLKWVHFIKWKLYLNKGAQKYCIR